MSRLLMFVPIICMMLFVGCSPKTDAEIKTDIETNLKTLPDVTGVTVDVKSGIVTIDGQCNDNIQKTNCERLAQTVTGVKTVINNLTVTTAAADTAAAAVTSPAAADQANEQLSSLDSALVNDPLTVAVSGIARKYPTVEAAVKDGVVTLTGEIKKNDLPKLMKALSSLKPKKIEQKLRVTNNAKIKNTRSKVSKKHAKPVKRSRRKH